MNSMTRFVSAVLLSLLVAGAQRPARAQSEAEPEAPEARPVLERFSEDAAGLLDRFTGLTWSREESGEPLAWDEAREACAAMGAWRLPSVLELEGLWEGWAAAEAPLELASTPVWTATTSYNCTETAPDALCKSARPDRNVAWLVMGGVEDWGQRQEERHAVVCVRSPMSTDEPSDYPCRRSPQIAAFDFWLGRWEVYQSGELLRESHVQRIVGRCAIRERWRLPGGTTGEIWYLYDPAAEQWSRTWQTAGGKELSSPGRLEGGRFVFAADFAETPRWRFELRIVPVTAGRVEIAKRIDVVGQDYDPPALTRVYVRLPP